MRREAIATSLTVLSLLAAGCIASPEEIDTAAAELDSPLLDSLFAFESPYADADDVIVLRTNASAEGGTAAFWWEIPEGVILGDEDDDKWIEFLAAPVLLEEERAPLERWMLMAFLSEGGSLALHSLAFGAPFTVEAAGPIGGESEEVERSLDPFLFGVGGKLRPGGRIGFVVSGVAAQDVEMALVLLPLQEEWDDDDQDMPEDTDEFLAFVQDRSHVALPVSGTGGMNQLALYYEARSGGFGGMAVTSGPVTIEGSTTDALVGARRGMVVSTEFGSGGYGIAGAGYDAQSATGTWTAIADAHGAVSEADGTLVPFIGPAIAGWPFVVAMGEGDAPASTSLTLDTASALGDSLYVVQLDLDATLNDLLGLPALTIESMTGNGQVEQRADGTVFNLGGARLTAVGLAQR